MSGPPPPPSPSREGSSSSHHPHQPAQPSNLRQSHTPSGRASDLDGSGNDADRPSSSSSRGPRAAATESTPLIQPDYSTHCSNAHPGACDHGTFSPRASTPTNTFRSDTGTSSGGLFDSSTLTGSEDWKSWFGMRMKTRKMGRSTELAERAGLNTNLMCVFFHTNLCAACQTDVLQVPFLLYSLLDVDAAIQMVLSQRRHCCCRHSLVLLPSYGSVARRQPRTRPAD